MINNNGTLDRNEFIKHCGDYYKKNNQPVDAEYLGTLTIEEVMKAFGTMKGYNQKDFENILALIDINKDKYIDYEEFKTMMIRIIE